MAAARRKEAEKAAAVRSAALQRRQRALRKLGLVPPPGSPYAEEPCLDMAQTWFAQVCRPCQLCIAVARYLISTCIRMSVLGIPPNNSQEMRQATYRFRSQERPRPLALTCIL